MTPGEKLCGKQIQPVPAENDRKRLNIAVIGWGFMGRMHTHVLRSIPLMYCPQADANRMRKAAGLSGLVVQRTGDTRPHR